MHRWRTQQTAIRNVNCRTKWIIESLNAYCAVGFTPYSMAVWVSDPFLWLNLEGRKQGLEDWVGGLFFLNILSSSPDYWRPSGGELGLLRCKLRLVRWGVKALSCSYFFPFKFTGSVEIVLSLAMSLLESTLLLSFMAGAGFRGRGRWLSGANTLPFYLI